MEKKGVIMVHIHLVNGTTIATDINLEEFKNVLKHNNFIELNGRHSPGGYNGKNTTYGINRGHIVFYEKIEG
jgi:hypothetical protein